MGLLLVLVFSVYSNHLKASVYTNSTNSHEVDLIIQANDVQIGGTLTLPAQQKSSSLVIMSSGSGPQDRDETLDGFKIFKVLAEHLASQGIATFRYDDRGVGSSTGDFVNSTIDDLTKDIEAIMDFFKSNEAHTFNHFILFGHSQGGIIAAKAAVGNPDVKQVVLMASPAVPLIEVVLYQARLEYASANLDASLIEAEVSAHNKLMSAIRYGENVDEALDEFKESCKAVMYALSSSEPAEVEQMANDKTNEFGIVYGLPSLASFLYYDPTDDLKQLEIPVLGLFGAKDLQVAIAQNKDRMENALLVAGVHYRFMTFDDANHFFQQAKTGLREEYETLDKEFVDNFLNEISAWILDN